MLTSSSATLLNASDPSAARGYSPVTVGWILFLSATYLSILSFLNAHVLHVSTPLVALFEAMLLLGCIAMLLKKIPLEMLLLIIGIAVWLSIATLLRQEFDAKGLRDLLIPIFFLYLGRQVADLKFADRTFKRVLFVVALGGLFEVTFVDVYAQVFNTFSLHINLGQIAEKNAMFAGQMLTLNGFRPEGIGRTILPGLLGNHRASSLLIDPVSLGNFAVIALAWGLSKEVFEWRKALPFIVGALLLIVLADSRFGLLMAALLLSMRLLPARLLGRLAPFMPVLAVAVVLAVPLISASYSDTFLGRLTASGLSLRQFNVPMLLGIGALPSFGDMGYSYILSRFGLPLCILLMAALFFLPNADPRSMRFRAFSIAYLALILSVSGTSAFAFKTAGLLWFLMGVLATLPAPTHDAAVAGAPATDKERAPHGKSYTVPNGFLGSTAKRAS